MNSKILGPYVLARTPMTPVQSKLYYDALKSSEGFDVPYFPDVDECLVVTPVLDLPFCLMKLYEHGTFAMEQYNRGNGTDFKIVEHVKTNYQFRLAPVYYFTFKAISSAHSYPTTFQAKVAVLIGGKKKVEIFRQSYPIVEPKPEPIFELKIVV